MSRHTEKRVEKLERETTVVICDLCGNEAASDEIHISDRDLLPVQNFWWKEPLNKIVGLMRGNPREVGPDGDLDVHVGCAHDAINEAIKERDQ